jgi:putative ABC transport system permease protein
VIRLTALNLARRPTRTALTALGIATGVAAIVALLSLTTGLERSASGLINLGDAEMGLFQSGVSDLTASTLPESLADRARSVDGVADAAPVAVTSTELQGESVLIFGVPQESFVLRRLVVVDGRRPGAGEAMVGDAVAREHGLAPGDSITVRGRSFPVAGIYHAGVPFEDQGTVLPLAAVQQLVERPGEATTLAVAVKPGARTDEVAERLEDAIPGTAAISEPGQAARADTNVLLVEKAALAIAILALVIGTLAAASTLLLSVVERREELALLAAIGWSPSRVARLVLGEGLALSVLGVVAGVGLGLAGGAAVVDALGVSPLLSPHVEALDVGRAALIGLGVGVLGGAYPAWRATRIPVSETLAT